LFGTKGAEPIIPQDVLDNIIVFWFFRAKVNVFFEFCNIFIRKNTEKGFIRNRR
jgi:hypothetical protein